MKKILLTPLASLGIVLTCGFMPHQLLSFHHSAQAIFLPQARELDSSLPKDPAQLLRRVVAKLAPEQLQWLRCGIHQEMAGEEDAFHADCRLCLGPCNCARLEMTVKVDGRNRKVVVVCDGSVLARCVETPGKETEINSTRLGKNGVNTLRASGCGGPYPMLAELERVLKNLEVEAGTWRERPALRVSGRIGDKSSLQASDPRLPCGPLECRLVVDAETLWPYQLEWASMEDGPVLRLEWRDPIVNIPLSEEECAREFSYTPPS